MSNSIEIWRLYRSRPIPAIIAVITQENRRASILISGEYLKKVPRGTIKKAQIREKMGLKRGRYI